MTETSEILNHPENDALKRKCVTYMIDIMTNYYQPDYSVSELYSECNSENTTLLSRHINPGHTIESRWFIIKTAKRTKFPDFIEKATLAIERAIDIGWDKKYGGLFRFVDLNGGKPTGIKQSSPFQQLITNTWDLKLWWPHSEALYGTMLAFKE